jgi:hypothetical protein
MTGFANSEQVGLMAGYRSLKLFNFLLAGYLQILKQTIKILQIYIYIYIYMTSLYLLLQLCVYFDTSHSLSSLHVSALRAIIM